MDPVRVFSKNGCVNCDIVLEALADADVEVVEVVKAPTKEERQAILDAAGLTTFPVVRDAATGVLIGGKREVLAAIRKATKK